MSLFWRSYGADLGLHRDLSGSLLKLCKRSIVVFLGFIRDAFFWRSYVAILEVLKGSSADRIRLY